MNSTALKELIKKHLVAAIFVGVSLLLAGAAIYRSSELPIRREMLEQRTSEGRRLQANITNASLLKENVEELAELNKQAAQRLVNPNQLGENLQFFYRVETAAGVKIIDLRQTYIPQGTKAVKSSFVSVPYTVSVQGDFRSVMNFVRKIEKSMRFSRIAAGSLGQAPSDGRNTQEVVTMTLNLELLGLP